MKVQHIYVCTITDAQLKFEAFSISAPSGGLVFMHQCYSWAKETKAVRLRGPLLLFEYSKICLHQGIMNFRAQWSTPVNRHICKRHLFGRSFCVASKLSERANTSFKKIVVYSNTGDKKKNFMLISEPKTKFQQRRMETNYERLIIQQNRTQKSTLKINSEEQTPLQWRGGGGAVHWSKLKNTLKNHYRVTDILAIIKVFAKVFTHFWDCLSLC